MSSSNSQSNSQSIELYAKKYDELVQGYLQKVSTYESEIFTTTEALKEKLNCILQEIDPSIISNNNESSSSLKYSKKVKHINDVIFKLQRLETLKSFLISM